MKNINFKLLPVLIISSLVVLGGCSIIENTDSIDPTPTTVPTEEVTPTGSVSNTPEASESPTPKPSNNIQQNSPTQQEVLEVLGEDYKDYKNDERKISFKYPSSFNILGPVVSSGRTDVQILTVSSENSQLEIYSSENELDGGMTVTDSDMFTSTSFSIDGNEYLIVGPELNTNATISHQFIYHLGPLYYELEYDPDAIGIMFGFKPNSRYYSLGYQTNYSGTNVPKYVSVEDWQEKDIDFERFVMILRTITFTD